MPVISSRLDVPANSTSKNVLAGELFEFMMNAGIVSLAISAEAADLVATFSIGGVSLLDRADIAPTNRVPIMPDDFLTAAGAVRGERLFLTIGNNTAGALFAKWIVRID